MDNMSKSKFMFGYLFPFFPLQKAGICFGKKCQKKNMSRRMAVQQLWKDLQMPWKGLKKTWKCLNKAWICNFLMLYQQCSKPSVVDVYIYIYGSSPTGLLLGVLLELKQSLGLHLPWLYRFRAFVAHYPLVN